MTQLVEAFELKKKSYVNWGTLVFAIMCLLAFLIAYQQKESYWFILGVLFFGVLFWLQYTNKITIKQFGIIHKTLFSTKEINWQDITELNFDVHYHGHGFSYCLLIYYGNKKRGLLINVNQYHKSNIDRLFEILDTQCYMALKNKYFLTMAKGNMNWKDKLKML